MLVVLVFATSCLAYWLYKRITRRSTEPPVQADGFPLIGHAHYLMFGTPDVLYDKMVQSTHDCLKDGGVTSTTFGPFNIYIVADPDAALTVFETCLEKDMFYEFWKPWMGNGLLTAPYSTAKPHRKLMLPVFNQRTLDEFIPTFNSQSRQLCNRIAEHVGKGPFIMSHYLLLNGLESILFTSCGQTECDKNLLNEYLDAVQDIHKLTVQRLLTVWYHNDFIYHWSGLKKIQDEKVKVLHKLSSEVIEKRKAILLKETYKTSSEVETPGFNNKNKILLDLLLELVEKEVITDEEMRDEINTAIFGGHDTSGGTLMFTLVLLGSHPEIQDRAYTELHNIFGNSDDDVMKKDLSNMVYIEAVIKESMRLYPFVALMARKIEKDIKTKNYTLSAGGRCLLMVYAIHRHSMWGDDANVFRPERWLEPDGLPSCPAAFAGFSWGKRGCIGKTYAMMSMKTTMAHLLRRYRFSADVSQMKLKYEVALKPISGHQVTIEHRV